MIDHRLRSARRKTLRCLLFVTALGSWLWIAVGQASLVAAPPSNSRAKSILKHAQARDSEGTTPQKGASPKRTKKVTTSKAKPEKSETEKQPVPTPKPSLPVYAKRDPFKPPAPPNPLGAPGAPEGMGPLPPGVRGLVINQLQLEGIVRQDLSNTMIAVVINYTKRAYFLRENDAVFNGVVGKITPDAVYFKENYVDTNGRVSSREVVKRMTPVPGEGR